MQPDWSFQSPPPEELWEWVMPQERLFQFFARMPREARHQPGCRYISSYLETNIGLIDQSQQAQFLDRTESVSKDKWLVASTKVEPPLSKRVPRRPLHK